MKLLYVTMAKVINLFDTRLINPKGAAPRELLLAIKDRYGFAKAPLNELDRTEKGSLLFESGVFFTNGTSVSVKLTIFSDGLVAETISNTDDTFSFLQDLRVFVEEFGCSIPPSSEIGIGVSSSVVIETETHLPSLNPKLDAVVKFIETRVTNLDSKYRDFELAKISIKTEDFNKPLAPSAFTFERRIDQPFSSNLYYSQAPLTTKDHLTLLDILEVILRT